MTEHQHVPEDEQDAFDQAPQPLVSESEGATHTEIMRGIREHETATVRVSQSDQRRHVIAPDGCVQKADSLVFPRHCAHEPTIMC